MVPEVQFFPLGERTYVTKLAGFEYTKHFDYSIGGEVIALRSLNIRNGSLDLSDIHTIPRDVSNALPRSQLKKGDIVLGYVGSKLGNLALIDLDNTYHLAPNVALIRASDEIDSRYLLQYMQGPYFQSRLWAFASSTGQPALSMGNIRNLPVPILPIEKQRKVAEILSIWDKAIATTEKLIANSEAKKKALMQKLLTGKNRLRGFDGEWKSARLDVLFKFKKGQGISKQAVCEEGAHSCILYGELYTRYGEIIDEVASRTNSNDGVPSVSGDLLIPASTTTSGIDLANVTAIGESGVKLGGDINILRMKKPNVSASFFAHYLTHVMKHDIASRAQGITIIHLYAAHLKDLEVQLPSLAEQEKISDVILTAAKEINSQKEKLQKLKSEKAALMQQLLTGKRRVAINKEEAVV